MSTNCIQLHLNKLPICCRAPSVSFHRRRPGPPSRRNHPLQPL